MRREYIFVQRLFRFIYLECFHFKLIFSVYKINYLDFNTKLRTVTYTFYVIKIQ